MKGRGRKVSPLTDQQQAIIEMNALLEAEARDGYACAGRGFLLYLINPNEVTPFVRCTTLDDEMGVSFATEADLVEAVRTYDPATSYVTLDGVVDMKRKVMRDVRVAINTFFFPQTPSA